MPFASYTNNTISGRCAPPNQPESPPTSQTPCPGPCQTPNNSDDAKACVSKGCSLVRCPKNPHILHVYVPKENATGVGTFSAIPPVVPSRPLPPPSPPPTPPISSTDTRVQDCRRRCRASSSALVFFTLLALFCGVDSSKVDFGQSVPDDMLWQERSRSNDEDVNSVTRVGRRRLAICGEFLYDDDEALTASDGWNLLSESCILEADITVGQHHVIKKMKIKKHPSESGVVVLNRQASSENNGRHFEVIAGDTLIVEGLTLTGGYADVSVLFQ